MWRQFAAHHKIQTFDDRAAEQVQQRALRLLEFNIMLKLLPAEDEAWLHQCTHCQEHTYITPRDASHFARNRGGERIGGGMPCYLLAQQLQLIQKTAKP